MKVFQKGINIFLILGLLINTFYFQITFAVDEKAELQRLTNQITDQQKRLKELDAEIEAQKKIVDQTSGQANTLSNKVKQLEASRNKLQADINKTQSQIENAELVLDKINLEITDKQRKINLSLQAISELIKKTDELEKVSGVERFLLYDSISDFWSEFENSTKIQNTLQSEIEVLLGISEELRTQEQLKIAEKEELSQFQVELSGEQEAIQSTKAQQEKLLRETKNKEAEYQKILNQKLAEKKAFEQLLLEIESQIKLLIDPNSFPTAGKGVLSWPVDNVIITQQFGGSQFAKNNPGIYGRAFHPGTDFGVPIGTKVKSVADGVVQALGNTDAYPGCNAWGKWILVKHDNGLTSLYAHNSSILASVGQRVTRGSNIALSGNTGYSTGPHLHLTLYASQGVQVGKYSSYKSGSGCSATDATGPFADLDAYLDPMSYLPAL